jgi:uncharacterized protein (DUF427 family)
MNKPTIIKHEPSARWVRAVVNGDTIASSHRCLLVWEPGHQLNYWFPISDVRMDLLIQESDNDIRRWALNVGDRKEHAAAWTYPDPSLAGGALQDHIAFMWRKVDKWYEEEEEIIVRPRDPYHRVDYIKSARHVVVKIDGQVVADSKHQHAIFETGLIPRWYLAKSDVRMHLLIPTDTRTGCPYKGWASYWSVDVNGTVHRDVVWAYEDPLRSVSPQFLSHRPSSRTSPHVQDAHDLAFVVDREEDAVRVGLPSVGEHPYWVIGVKALGRDGTPVRC